MAPRSTTSTRSRTVTIVAYPGVQSLDLAGPYEVFAGAARAAEAFGIHAGYEVEVVSSSGGAVTTESGLALDTKPLLDDSVDIDTLVLAGGGGVAVALEDAELIEWIRSAAARSRRVATVCSGTFLAARAGLADGRRVTTHWARAAELAAQFPAVTVDPDPIYVHDGDLWSSAGVTAGIDLALALVEEDLGTDVSQLIARWLVMFVHRPGGQTQFATPVWAPRARRTAVRDIQARVEADPGGDHRVATLAESAAMSERHFTRVFTAEVGESPSRYVERVRTEAARHELEATGDTLQVIAARCGFGTTETLRRTFQRRLHSSPDSYRRRFARTPTERTQP
jgi:transcriptional regulator GlxA family with amidase domain